MSVGVRITDARRLGKELAEARYDAETERLFSIPAFAKLPKKVVLHRVKNIKHNKNMDHRFPHRKISKETADRYFKWVQQTGGKYQIRLN
jgi:hypothetical protein